MTYRALLALTVASASAYPCSIARPVSNTEVVENAQVIIRATAIEQVSSSTVRFTVDETIRGPHLKELVLKGELGAKDDFNDQPPPYDFVRPGGRHGNCFALSYKKGAMFLLLLTKDRSGDLTPYWYALGPVNEQLHSDSDPWLTWVREKATAK